MSSRAERGRNPAFRGLLVSTLGAPAATRVHSSIQRKVCAHSWRTHAEPPIFANLCENFADVLSGHHGFRGSSRPISNPPHLHVHPACAAKSKADVPSIGTIAAAASCADPGWIEVAPTPATDHAG